MTDKQFMTDRQWMELCNALGDGMKSVMKTIENELKESGSEDSLSTMDRAEALILFCAGLIAHACDVAGMPYSYSVAFSWKVLEDWSEALRLHNMHSQRFEEAIQSHIESN